MQQAKERHGYYATDRVMRFLLIRIRSRPEIREIAEEVSVYRKALGAKHENYLQVREERLACSAEIAYLSGEITDIVMDLSRHILVKTKNNRHVALYRKVFPIAPSEAMRSTASSQERYVFNILHCLENDPDYQMFVDHTQRLREHQILLKQASEQRNTLHALETQAHVEFRIAKNEAQHFYNHAYYRLMLMLPNQRNLVESFFTDFHIRSKKKSQEDKDTNDPD